jgi:hypothetical protein
MCWCEAKGGGVDVMMVALDVAVLPAEPEVHLIYHTSSHVCTDHEASPTIMLHHAVLCCVWPVLSHCIMVLSHRAHPAHAVSTCAMLCHAVPCCAMLCHAVPCHAVLCCRAGRAPACPP